jgi:hypothetical protein
MKIKYEQSRHDGPDEINEYEVRDVVEKATNDGRDVVAAAEILARLIDNLAERGVLSAIDVDDVVFGYSSRFGRLKGFVQP